MTQQAMPAPQAAQQQQAAGPDMFQSLLMLHADLRKQRTRLRDQKNPTPQQNHREMVDTFGSILEENVQQQISLFHFLLNEVVSDIDARLNDLEEGAEEDEYSGMSDETLLNLVQFLSEGQVVAAKALEACETDEEKAAIESWRTRGIQLVEELAPSEEDGEGASDEDQASEETPQDNGAPAPTAQA